MVTDVLDWQKYIEIIAIGLYSTVITRQAWKTSSLFLASNNNDLVSTNFHSFTFENSVAIANPNFAAINI